MNGTDEFPNQTSPLTYSSPHEDTQPSLHMQCYSETSTSTEHHLLPLAHRYSSTKHQNNEPRSCVPHRIKGWYIGPSPEHYRCYNSYILSTRGNQDALTVKWFPKTVPIPKVTNKEYIRQTAEDMITILQQQKKTSIPSLQFGQPTTNAFIQIAQILKRATKHPRQTTHTAETRVQDTSTQNTTPRQMSMTMTMNPPPQQELTPSPA